MDKLLKFLLLQIALDSLQKMYLDLETEIYQNDIFETYELQYYYEY